MLIQFKTKKLESICTNAYQAQKKYGKDIAIKIHQRIDEIRAADSIEEMLQYHIGGCHKLSGDREGQYATNLDKKVRLVFEVIKNGELTARILEIVNYH